MTIVGRSISVCKKQYFANKRKILKLNVNLIYMFFSSNRGIRISRSNKFQYFVEISARFLTIFSFETQLDRALFSLLRKVAEVHLGIPWNILGTAKSQYALKRHTYIVIRKLLHLSFYSARVHFARITKLE